MGNSTKTIDLNIKLLIQLRAYNEIDDLWTFSELREYTLNRELSDNKHVFLHVQDKTGSHSIPMNSISYIEVL